MKRVAVTVAGMARVPVVPWVREDGALIVGGGQLPPSPTYVPVTAESTGIVGQPCVWLDGPSLVWEFGWRVVDGPWVSASGKPGVTVCPEAQWWPATLTGQTPQGALRLRAECVWLVAHGGTTPA